MTLLILGGAWMLCLVIVLVFARETQRRDLLDRAIRDLRRADIIDTPCHGARDLTLEDFPADDRAVLEEVMR